MVGIAQVARIALQAAVLKQFDRAHAEQTVRGERRAAACGGSQREVEIAVLGQKLHAVFEHPAFVGQHVVAPHGSGHAAVVGRGHALGHIVVGGPFQGAEPCFLGHLRRGFEQRIHGGGFLHQPGEAAVGVAPEYPPGRVQRVVRNPGGLEGPGLLHRARCPEMWRRNKG